MVNSDLNLLFSIKHHLKEVIVKKLNYFIIGQMAVVENTTTTNFKKNYYVLMQRSTGWPQIHQVLVSDNFFLEIVVSPQRYQQPFANCLRATHLKI